MVSPFFIVVIFAKQFFKKKFTIATKKIFILQPN